MALNLHNKKKIVEYYHNIAKKSVSIITANTLGITSNEINKLRKKARLKNVKISVIRNTLLKKSLNDTPFSLLKDTLTGPTLIAFSIEHPGSASRLFQEYNKKNPKFKIKNAIFEEKILNTEEIKALALMPTYHESLYKITYILKEISIGKLLRALSQIKLKKLKR